MNHLFPHQKQHHNCGSRSPVTQVSTKSCINIDDFAKKVKQELNTNSQVAFFTSLDNEPIKPWLTIKELIKTEFKNNSGEIPLFVKIIPATQDQAKTIYIRDTDDDGKLKDEYIKYNVKKNENLRDIYKNGQGLIQLSDRF